MAALVRQLKVRLPRPGLARHDPWGLRAGVLLMLVIGLVAARQDAGPRLLRHRSRSWRWPGAAFRRTVDHAACLHRRGADVLHRRRRGPRRERGVWHFGCRSPARYSSAAWQRCAGPRRGIGRAPVLAVDSSHIQFLPLASDIDNKRTWRAETLIGEGNRILVRAGRQTLAEWPIQVIPDAPPLAAFAEAPREEGDGLLSIGYAAQDDHGVAELTAVIEAADDQVRATGDGSALRVALPNRAWNFFRVRARSPRLSDQALAGLPVKMYLEAKDVGGQTGVAIPSKWCCRSARSCIRSHAPSSPCASG